MATTPSHTFPEGGLAVNRNRRRRPTFTASDIAFASAFRGCTCRPDVRRRHVAGRVEAALYHDGDCPAADSGSVLLLKRHSHETAEEFAAVVVELLRALEEPA